MPFADEVIRVPATLAAARAAADRRAAAGLRPAAGHGQGPRRRPAAQPGQVASRSSRTGRRRDRRGRHRRRRRRAVRADPRAHPRPARAAVHRRGARPARSTPWPRGSRPRRPWPRRSARRSACTGTTPRCCAAPTAARTCRCAAPCRPGPTTWACTPCTCPCPTTPASRRPSSSPRAEDAVIEAYSVERVRAAEAAADGASCPTGELMARAARGPRRGRRGPPRASAAARRVVALVGAGRQRRRRPVCRRPPRRGGLAAAVVPCRSTPHACTGWRAAAAAGGRGRRRSAAGDPRAVELVAEADVVLDGILGIGGRPGLPPERPWPWVDAVPDDAYGHRGRPAERARTLPGETSAPTMRVRRRDGDLRRRQAGAPAAGDRARGRACSPWSTSASTSTAPPTVQRLDPRRRRRAVAGARPPADDKYSRGVLGVVAGGEGYTGAAVLCVTAAVAAGVGMVRYVGTADPDRAGPRRRARGRARRRAGAGVGGRARASTPRRHRPRRAAQLDAARAAPWPPTCPCVVDAGGLDLARAGPRPRADPAHAARRRAGPAAHPARPATRSSRAATVDGRARCAHARRARRR